MTAPGQRRSRERSLAGGIQGLGAERLGPVFERDAAGWHSRARCIDYNGRGESNTLVVIGRIERRGHRAGGGIFIHRLRKRGRGAGAEAGAAVVSRGNGVRGDGQRGGCKRCLA